MGPSGRNGYAAWNVYKRKVRLHREPNLSSHGLPSSQPLSLIQNAFGKLVVSHREIRTSHGLSIKRLYPREA